MGNVIKFPIKPRKQNSILWLYESIGCLEDIQEKIRYFNEIAHKANPNKIVQLYIGVCAEEKM